MAVTGGTNVVYKPGSIVSFATSAAVTAGRLVEISGNKTVAHAATKSRKAIGVALQTGSASGDTIAVQLLVYVFKLTASGAITAGDELVAAADGSGKVSTAPVTATTIGAAYAEAATEQAIDDARAIVGVSFEGIADTASGWVGVRV